MSRPNSCSSGKRRSGRCFLFPVGTVAAKMRYRPPNLSSVSVVRTILRVQAARGPRRWNAGSCRVRNWSLYWAHLLFAKYFVEQSQVIESGNVGLRPAEKAFLKGLLRGFCQRRTDRIVGDL